MIYPSFLGPRLIQGPTDPKLDTGAGDGLATTGVELQQDLAPAGKMGESGTPGVEWRIPDHPTGVTGLLLQWGQGDEAALERLVPLVQRELHRIARRCMAGERAGHSFQATALLNEAYARLIDGAAVAWQDRAHFYAVCARLMRRILVDHARARNYQKRGGGAQQVTFDEALVVAAEPSQDFEALDDALQALARFDERKSRVIELRFFGGLTVDETASVLDVSPDTVHRDWRLAKAWLQAEMKAGRRDA